MERVDLNFPSHQQVRAIAHSAPALQSDDSVHVFDSTNLALASNRQARAFDSTTRSSATNCRCDVCDSSQDDGRRTVSEQGVQCITSKETAQTQAQGPLRQTNTGSHENLTKGHRVRKTSARRNARQVPKIHQTNTTNVCAQLLTHSICYIFLFGNVCSWSLFLWLACVFLSVSSCWFGGVFLVVLIVIVG